jgi:DNA-binding NarL/FixJ family response regulator
MTDKEIGLRLSISERTAGNHVTSIIHKLELASRRDVAVFAIKRGLLVPVLPPNGSE